MSRRNFPRAGSQSRTSRAREVGAWAPFIRSDGESVVASVGEVLRLAGVLSLAGVIPVLASCCRTTCSSPAPPPREEDRVPALLAALRTDHWESAALELANQADTDRVLSALESLLRQTMKGERRPFESRSGQGVAQCLSDERCRTRWTIMVAISKMGDRAVPFTDILLDLDLRNEGEVRNFSWASLVAGQFGAAAIPAIVQRMKSVDEALRVQGLQVIRKMEGRASPALPILRNMLQNDAAWNVRLHALDAIAHAAPGDPSVRRDVEGAAAGDSDERVRARARWALESVLRDR